MISQVELKELFDYDPETGWFINRTKRAYNKNEAGQRAGYQDARGYRRITVHSVKYYEHHMAWLYVYGEWRTSLDHIDGVCSHNAIHNLRAATQSQNLFNAERTIVAQSGFTGVYLDKRRGHWRSEIQVECKKINLGRFATAQEASEAFEAARQCYHGEFALANRP